MKIPTPLRAIRLKCLDCCCGSAQEVRECPITHCPLFFYRSGHNPNRQGKGKATNLPTKAHTISDLSEDNTADDKCINTAKKDAEKARKGRI